MLRPKEERSWYTEVMGWAATLASWVGVATHAANHEEEEPHRDSTAEAEGRGRGEKEGEQGP